VPITIDDLRRFTVVRSLSQPTTLKRALHRLGFVQADPIRAPARAQDLILRLRVRNYHSGDLDRHYSRLGIEEDFFINYGFVTRELQALMHPRSNSCVPAEGGLPWPTARRKRALLLLDFVRQRGEVHPQEVDAHFSHGSVKNYWGGTSNATTHLLDAMHYQGLLRVVRREKGIRIYSVHEHGPMPSDREECRRRMDALADVAIRIYAPLPLPSLRFLLRRLRFAVPQWEAENTAAIQRAKDRLAHAQVEGVSWYWPIDEEPSRAESDEAVRFLAPFDPVVWDRDRFELLWNWVYRFEAYTPVAKRVRGYYALPMLWRDRVIGWGNLSVIDGDLRCDFGYVESHAPRHRSFKRELEAEVERMKGFLGLKS
jgi:uncharacterized protein YcaQ